MAQSHERSSQSSESQQTEVDEQLDSQRATEAEHKAELDEDIDAILGEIDDVLETNAEDFVKSFIQKGGQ